MKWGSQFQIKSILLVIAMVAPTAAYSDNCSSVKREMIYGQTALKKANNKHGYLKSAEEFETAIQKAPNCAAAHFNLGLVYEKAEEYKLALKNLESYLRLSPGAADKSIVKEKIYELEYLIKDDARTIDIKGMWRKFSPGYPPNCSQYMFDFKKSGQGYEASMHQPADFEATCKRVGHGFISLNLSITGVSVTGSITQDMNWWTKKPPRASWTVDVSGSIDKDGKIMKLKHKWLVPEMKGGAGVNGWFYQSVTLYLRRGFK